jgi:hypothetical protein
MGFNALTQNCPYSLQTEGDKNSSYTVDFSATADPIIHHAPFVIG